MKMRDFIIGSLMAAGTLLAAGKVGTGAVGLAESDKKKDKDKRMKIVVLTGSPRRNGNSAHLAEQFIKGAREAGHDVFRFDCAFANVAPCRACNHCGMDGPCVSNDDFEALRPHLLEADMVVFATPLYYFGFSSQLKAVIDRFYAINGQIKGAAKKAALLMTYADTAPREAEPLLSHYEALTEYLGWKSVGTVVAPGVWPAGAVRDTRYAGQAYRLGKDL